jgi:predicted dehydrogenase
MADKIRVGIVGANASRSSWSTRSHIPALKALPKYELKAICTAHEDTAIEAAKAFGAEHAFHDYNAMVVHPEVDLVVVAVRVPYHHEITMAALNAGKDVFCEWALGANLAEAEEMADLAREKGVRTMVGLQGRSDPALMYVRDLVTRGQIGDLLSVSMTAFAAGPIERPSDRAWQRDRKLGTNTLTITGGQALDSMCFCAGEFVEVAGKIATQVKQWHTTDTDEWVDVTSPDNVLVAGVLDNGALASVHVASVPSGGSGFRLEVYGRDGAIFVSTNGSVNIGPSRVLLAKGGEPPAEQTIPDRFVLVPDGTPKGQARNVAQAYVRYADGAQGERSVVPDFELAVRRHRLLAALERASEEGRTVSVG